MADRRRSVPPSRTKPRGQAPAHPWVLPVIVAVAIAVVVTGLVWASVLGHLF
jgi:hypothetical protein